MRTIMMITLMLAGFGTAQAAGKPHFPPPGTVVALYECMQVNPATAHFTCATQKNGDFVLTWQTDVRKLPTQERRRAMYEYSKLALDIVQYGNVFQQRSLVYPGQSTTCQLARTKYIAIVCD